MDLSCWLDLTFGTLFRIRLGSVLVELLDIFSHKTKLPGTQSHTTRL